MTIVLPPELSWAARLTGQPFPQADESKMFELAALWQNAGTRAVGVTDSLNSVVGHVLEAVSGQGTAQFAAYAADLRKVFPQLAAGAADVGNTVHEGGVEFQYGKLMIVMQLSWMAEQILEWGSTIFGAAVIPVVEAAGTFAVRAIMRRLISNVAVTAVGGAVVTTVMDNVVQGLQFLLGDRTRWNANDTKSAAEFGALGGAIGGAFHSVFKIAMPRLSETALGHVGVGVSGGVFTALAANSALQAHVNVGLAGAAGAAGGLLGWRGGHAGGAGTPRISIPDITVLHDFIPHLPHLPGETPPPHTGEFGPTADGYAPTDAKTPLDLGAPVLPAGAHAPLDLGAGVSAHGSPLPSDPLGPGAGVPAGAAAARGSVHTPLDLGAPVPAAIPAPTRPALLPVAEGHPAPLDLGAGVPAAVGGAVHEPVGLGAGVPAAVGGAVHEPVGLGAGAVPVAVHAGLVRSDPSAVPGRAAAWQDTRIGLVRASPTGSTTRPGSPASNTRPSRPWPRPWPGTPRRAGAWGCRRSSCPRPTTPNSWHPCAARSRPRSTPGSATGVPDGTAPRTTPRPSPRSCRRSAGRCRHRSTTNS